MLNVIPDDLFQMIRLLGVFVGLYAIMYVVTSLLLFGGFAYLSLKITSKK